MTVRQADGTVETVAFTNPLALEVDELQRELEQGPAYSAEEDDWRLEIADFADELQWPAYGARVAELGIRSQIAIRLRVNGRRRAVLNLYGREPGAVTGHHDLIELFVTHSALAIDFGEAIDQLSDALRSRKMIGQALGLVMGQYGMTEEQAFAYVRRISQDRNVKLRDVCVALVTEFDAGRPAAVDGNERPTAQVHPSPATPE